jgi:hypothetical protein
MGIRFVQFVRQPTEPRDGYTANIHLAVRQRSHGSGSARLLASKRVSIGIMNFSLPCSSGLA